MSFCAGNSELKSKKKNQLNKCTTLDWDVMDVIQNDTEDLVIPRVAKTQIWTGKRFNSIISMYH